MLPQMGQLTRASVSFVALCVLLSTTSPASAQNTSATPSTIQPEATAPAQLPMPDPAQERVAELEIQITQRKQELEVLQGQLRGATEQLTTLQQQQAEVVQARETLSGQLAGLDQRIAALEGDLSRAREAEAAARSLAGERDAASAQLRDELTALKEVNTELQQQLEHTREVADQASRGLIDRENRLATLEHEASVAQEIATYTQQELERRQSEQDRLSLQLDQMTGERAALEQQLAETTQARWEADQLTLQVQELGIARDDLNRQLAELGQAREQAAQELEARAQRLTALEHDVTAAQQELKERSAEIERLTSELHSATEARDKLEAYAVDRTKLLEQAGHDVRAGHERIEALEQQLNELRNTNAVAQSELAKFGTERANSEKQLVELTSSLDAANAEAVRQKAAADEAQGRYAKLDAQVTAIEPYRLSFVNEARALLDGRAGVTVAEDRIILETDGLYVGRATLRLTEDGRSRLRAVAQALAAGVQQIPAELPWLLRVEGHTDDTPLTSRSIFDTNWALSAARAAAAAEYLTQQGIPGEHVSTVGMSQYRPLVTEQTPEAKRQNRRLEITLVAQR